MKSNEVKKLINSSNPVILDIGCHIGQDSIVLLNTIPNSKVYCFEADPEVCNRFRTNIFNSKNLHAKNNIFLFETAIGSEIGFISFNRSNQFKSGTLQNPTEHLEYHPTVSFTQITVPCTTLDKWYEENIPNTIIDFIWSDVNGAEKKLIEGAYNTLNTAVKYIQLECINRAYWEGQIFEQEILTMLPDFEIISKDGHDILLKNKNL